MSESVAVDVKAVLEEVLALLEREVPLYQIIPEVKKILADLEHANPTPAPEPTPAPKPAPAPKAKAEKKAAPVAQTAKRGDADPNDGK